MTLYADLCTACGHRIAHRKWKETKLQPGTAGPGIRHGCCLVSFHFLWAILCPQAVLFVRKIGVFSDPSPTLCGRNICGSPLKPFIYFPRPLSASRPSSSPTPYWNFSPRRCRRRRTLRGNYGMEGRAIYSFRYRSMTFIDQTLVLRVLIKVGSSD